MDQRPPAQPKNNPPNTLNRPIAASRTASACKQSDSTAAGNLSAAETRITDLETAWDAAQPELRPLNTAAWGTVDGAIDDALSALRAKTVNAAKAETALADLQTVLADPFAATVDATGAGDQFAAGFLYGLATGAPLEVAGRMGCIAAAEVITHYGARPKADIKALFAAAGLV